MHYRMRAWWIAYAMCYQKRHISHGNATTTNMLSRMGSNDAVTDTNNAPKRANLYAVK